MNYFNFSATSSEPFYKSKKNQRGGGDCDRLIARALIEHNYEALLFLVKDSNIELSATNENGQTLLHLLIDQYEKSPKINEILDCVLSRNDINVIINIRDSNGNTALHLAVMKNLHNLCDELIRAGADPTLKNEAGLYVESITETQTERGTGSVLTEVSMESREDELKNAVPLQLSDTSIEKPQLGGSHSSNIFLKHNSTHSMKSHNSTANSIATSTAKGFTDFLNETATMVGGKNNFSEYSELINTSEFINDFIRKNVHAGGAKKKKTKKMNEYGSRMEIPMSQTSAFNIESTESDNESSLDEMSELSRMINNQASEIHERSIKKIMELLKDINGKATEQEARAIKAIIYNQVKESNPELNNFDRAVEMEKRITKETIENIDSKKIKEITNIITEKQKEKTVSIELSSDEPKKKKSTKTPAKKTAKKETKTKKSKKFIREGMIDSSSTTTLGTDSDSSDTLSTTDSSNSATSE